MKIDFFATMTSIAIMFVFAFCLPFWSAHKLNSVHIPERAAVRTDSYSSLQN